MADCWDQSRGNRGWNPQFLRLFNDWELDQVYSLLSTIQEKMVFPEEKDKLMWNPSKDGCFSVKSLYGVLEGRREGLFPRKMIWNSCLHTKVSSFHLGSLVRQSDKKILVGQDFDNGPTEKEGR